MKKTCNHGGLAASIGIIILLFSAMPAFAVTTQADHAESYYHYLMGTMREHDRDFNAAINEYREALKYDPNSSDIYARLADLYVQANRIDEAVQDAQKALAQNPNNKEAHKMLGQIYLEKLYASENDPEDLKKAISEFEQVRKLDPDDDYAELSLGQLYLQNGQPTQAAELLEKYVQGNGQSPTAIVALASAYQQLNQNDKAISYMQQYLDENPDNLYILQQLITLYEKKGDFRNAVDLQKRAYEADSDNPAIFRKYVDLLSKTQQYPQAITLLEQRLKQEPQKIEWSVILAKTLQEAGNQDRAESVMQQQITSHPDDQDLKLALIQIYEDGKKYNEAIQQLKTMAQKVESDKSMNEKDKRSSEAVIYSHLGYAAQQTKNYDSAIDYYKKARAVVDASDTPKFDFYIALNYRNEKKYDQAIDTINAVLKDNPNDSDSWELLSLVYEEKGDQQSSDKVLQHLIDTHPGTADYFVLKAERLQQRDKYADSLTFLKTVQAKFSTNDQILFLLGAASERMKNYDSAEEYFKQTIALNPQNANALNYLGYMLIDRGARVEEGIDYIKRALQIDRDNGAFLDSLGWGYFKLNKLDLAEDNLRMALQRLDDNAVVHDHIGDLYFKLGKFKDAIQHWEIAVKGKSDEIDPQYIQKKIDDTKNRIQ
jgi:tetratricopeptide (TPR) repeat protein